MNNKETYISKEQTLQIKGIAILLMLWLHLFIKPDHFADLTPLLSIGQYPLAHYLSRFGGACVSMYIFLSGYGLWIVYRRGRGMHNGRRIAQLYALVALISLLFYPWHNVLNPELGWAFGLAGIANSVSGYQPYNLEWWFLFPYVIVMLLSPFIFKLLTRSPRHVIAGSVAAWLLSTAAIVYLLHYVWGSELYSTYRPVEQVLILCQFMMPFTVGALCAKTGLLKTLSECAMKYKLVMLAVLCLLLLGQCAIGISSLNYIVGILFCFVGATFSSTFLTKMGGGKHGDVALPYVLLLLLLRRCLLQSAVPAINLRGTCLGELR